MRTEGYVTRALPCHRLTPQFLSVLFAIFALGDRVIKTNRAWLRERARSLNGFEPSQDSVMPGEAEAGVIWFERYVRFKASGLAYKYRAQILHYTSLSDIDLHQVQCLTLMSAFQASVNAMPSSWLLAGQAMRIAQDLGLHRRTPQYKMIFAEKQLCRRCWWAIYGLERMVSISLGRPLGVEDVDIDVPYPAEIDDEATYQLVERDGADPYYPEVPPEAAGGVMSGFNALTQLCKIAGNVAHLLHRPNHGKNTNDQSWAASQQTSVNKLDKQLRDWLVADVVGIEIYEDCLRADPCSPRSTATRRPSVRYSFSLPCYPTRTLRFLSLCTATSFHQTRHILGLNPRHLHNLCLTVSKRLDRSFISLHSKRYSSRLLIIWR